MDSSTLSSFRSELYACFRNKIFCFLKSSDTFMNSTNVRLTECAAKSFVTKTHRFAEGLRKNSLQAESHSAPLPGGVLPIHKLVVEECLNGGREAVGYSECGFVDGGG